MHLPRLTACVGVALFAVALLAATRPAPTPSAHDAEAREVRRIRLHLDSALALLETNDVRHLSSAQRARRVVAIESLRAYRNRGEFPHNYDFAAMTPYFVDRKTGTLCAVAYLLSSTGRNDIVTRVAHADNNIRVRELAGDSALTNWLRENGLSLDEAAFIQVVYVNESSDVVMYSAAASVALLVPTLTTGVWNLAGNEDGHRPWISGIGLVAGLASVGAGAQIRVSSGPDQKFRGLGNTNMIIGGAAAALAVHTMLHHHRVVANERAASRRAVSDATISPIVSTDHSRTGMAVSLRF